jgi:formylglycine-generating enzyme required for sulfatase activity
MLATVLALGTWGGREYFGRLHAHGLRDRLLNAPTVDVPEIMGAMATYRRWVDPLLEAADAGIPADDARKRLNLSLALLPSRGDEVQYLYGRLLGADPHDFPVICAALAPHRDALTESLWAKLADDQAELPQRFRAACALAAYAPDDPRWAQFSAGVTAQLLAQGPLELVQWKDALRPVAERLLPPLAAAVEEEGLSAAQRRTIAKLYEDYAGKRPDAFARLEERLRGGSVPAAPRELRVASAWRRANVGAALVAMGRGEPVWPHLVHSPDPTLRSCLIERLVPGGADPEVLERRLAREPDPSARRALILALGGTGPDRLPVTARKRLLPGLLRRYCDDPDPGTHAAAEWVARSWGAADQLAGANRDLATGRPEGGRQWYVNRAGQTFSVVPAHAQPLSGGGPARVFTIATKEVTVAEFMRFRKEHRYSAEKAPSPDCPVNSVTWYEAAEYCNWLSATDGIPRDQWCYLPNAAGQYAEGMKIAPDWQRLTGYRMPTEAEWEVACRAGAQTDWSCGDADAELVGQYAWWYGNSLASGVSRSAPVGTLKPNDLGLFDMLGNVGEWCQDQIDEPNPVLPPTGVKERNEIGHAVHRPIRGGTFVHSYLGLVSSFRVAIYPEYRPSSAGVRPGRKIR